MRALADANVLFPLVVSAHPARAAALEWWNRQNDDAVGLCLPVQLAVLRHLTNATIMNGAPVAPTQAWEAWQRLAEDPRCFSAPPPPSTLDDQLLRFIQGRSPSPNLWTDAWLAACAVVLELELVTFDRGFLAFGLSRLLLLKASA